MSLLRTERLAVSLLPASVGVALASRGWGPPRRVERAVLEVKPQEAGTSAWKAPLDVLSAWLKDRNPRGAKTRLVLSNRFVRFALMPWAPTADAAEERELALACLESRYGDMAGWTPQLDRGRYGLPRLVCAIETELLEKAREALAAYGLRCDGIVPAFVAGWNRCRKGLSKELGAGAGVFAVVESDNLVMATCRAGNWHSARATALRKGFREVPALLEREALLQGFADPLPAWVALPVAERHAKVIEAGSPLLRVVGAGDESQAALALADWGGDCR